MKKIGIIGGGQLGMMIAQAAKSLGAYIVTLDPSDSAPAFKFSDEVIVAQFTDVEALERLCERCDVVTYEFENIPAELLVPLCEKYNIKQGYAPLLDSQNRVREKRNAQQNGLQTPLFEEVTSMQELEKAVAKIGLPAVLKSQTMGYDGRGQMILRTEADVEKAADLLRVECILEQFVDFDYECSVIVVRKKGGEYNVLPIAQNIHREGILDLSIVPAPKLSKELEQKIIDQTVRFMEGSAYEGILTIEYFVKGETFIFNEMAPRPHNSGHYSIEGATVSQFTSLVEYLLDMPLTQSELVAPTVMKNILGEDLEVAKTIDGENIHLHLYGKTESHPKRKMGHVTYVGMTHEEFEERHASKFVK